MKQLLEDYEKFHAKKTELIHRCKDQLKKLIGEAEKKGLLNNEYGDILNEEYNRNKYGNLGKLIQDMDWDWYDYLIEYKAAGKWPAPDRWGLKFKLDKRFGIKVTDSIPYTDDEIYCDEYKNNLEIPYNISESGLWTTIHLLELVNAKVSPKNTDIKKLSEDCKKLFTIKDSLNNRCETKLKELIGQAEKKGLLNMEYGNWQETDSGNHDIRQTPDFLIEYRGEFRGRTYICVGTKFKLDKKNGIVFTDDVPYRDEKLHFDEYESGTEIPYVNWGERHDLGTTIHLLDLIDSKLSKHR